MTEDLFESLAFSTRLFSTAAVCTSTRATARRARARLQNDRTITLSTTSSRGVSWKPCSSTGQRESACLRIFAAMEITINPLTLCFSDWKAEQDFRVGQLRQVVAFGWISNLVVIVFVAVIVAAVGENSPTWLYVAATISVSGMATALPVGRLSDGMVEHNIVVYGGVANIVFGYGAITCMLSQSPSAIVDVVAFSVLMIGYLMMLFAMHVLIFPFWARLSIVSISFVYKGMANAQSELGHTNEFLLFGVQTFIGEFAGYALQRGIRRLYLETLDLKAQKAAIVERNEQLACEKERANMMYAMELAKPRSRIASTMRRRCNESNQSEGSQSNEELKGWLGGSASCSSHPDADVRDETSALLDSSFAPIPSEQRSSPERRERKQRLWQTLAEMELLQDRKSTRLADDDKLPLPGEVEADELLGDWEESDCASLMEVPGSM
jgi:hypothetical protein